MTAIWGSAAMSKDSVTEYRGDVSPSGAWRILAEDTSAVLIDVRTGAEWRYVGVPDLSQLGKEPIFACWQMYPGMEKNLEFVSEVANRNLHRDATLLFLCRSGARSKAAAAAMTGAGFSNCFNVSEGFEGDRDSEKHRSRVGGWKKAGLPWAQN